MHIEHASAVEKTTTHVAERKCSNLLMSAAFASRSAFSASSFALARGLTLRLSASAVSAEDGVDVEVAAAAGEVAAVLSRF